MCPKTILQVNFCTIIGEEIRKSVDRTKPLSKSFSSSLRTKSCESAIKRYSVDAMRDVAEIAQVGHFSHRLSSILIHCNFRLFLLDCLNNGYSCSDDSEYEDSVYSRSDSDGEMNSCRGAGALLSEPEIKFTSEELSGLQILVERHDEQYKSVNHDAHFNFPLTSCYTNISSNNNDSLCC